MHAPRFDTPSDGLRLLLHVVTVLAVTTLSGLAQRPPDPKVATELDRRRTEVFHECAQRHMFLGSWARKKGLVAQATREFLRAVEVGEGENSHAYTLIDLMRRYGPRFWRGERRTFKRGLLQSYSKRLANIDKQNDRDRYGYAMFAHRYELRDEALRVFEILLREHGSVFEYDKKGRIELRPGPIPDDLTDDLKKLVRVEVGQDEQLVTAEDAKSRWKTVADDEVVVRGGEGIEAATLADLHAAATALMPHLEDRLLGRPSQVLEVRVLATRNAYRSALDDRLAAFSDAHGIADYETRRATVCAEGLDADGLRGLVLHELTHLFDYGVVPTVMPAWYREGLAESFGGAGAYRWDGEKLEVGGLLTSDRLALLRGVADDFSLDELLAADMTSVWASGGEPDRFYALAWAFERYLRSEAELAASFSAWETACRGGALGIDPKAGRSAHGASLREAKAVDAGKAFEEAFEAAGRGGLEAGFRVFLRGLKDS